MKKAVYIEFDQYGEELSGHCARFAYRLMNFCVKAEEVALLPIEAMIDGDLVKLDECSIVGRKDDYTFMIIPNFAEDMPAIAQGVMMEHPEFKQSMEEKTLDTVDEKGQSIKKNIRYLLLKMPEVDDERYKVLKNGVELCYNDCKAAMELANNKFDAKLTPLLAGESDADIESLKNVRDKVNTEWGDHREKLYHEKIQEIEDAHNNWMADRVEDTLTRLQDEDRAKHDDYSAHSMKMGSDDEF